MFLYEAAHVAFCYNCGGSVYCLAVQGRQLSEDMKRGGESYGAQQRLIDLKAFIQETITSVNNLGIRRYLTTFVQIDISQHLLYIKMVSISALPRNCRCKYKSDLDSTSGNLE